MLNLFYFLIFIIYIVLIFCLKNIKLLAILFLLQLTFYFSKKIKFRKLLSSISMLLPFILLTFIFNLFFDTIYNSLLVLVKLILVCITTFNYKEYFGTLNIVNAISKLLAPFQFFGISSYDISLIINISLTFIPNFIKEYKQISLALKAKGFKLHSTKTLKIISKLLLISTLKKTNQLEFTLKSKAYIEK